MMIKTNVYIDTNNLQRSAVRLGYKINYYRFRNWLTGKFKTDTTILFIGYLDDKAELYKSLQEMGYKIVFRKSITRQGIIKANCDAEMILHTLVDFFNKKFDKCVLITGDGDFGCLIEFLKSNESISCVVAPDKFKCSFLIKNKNIQIIFLNDIYHKFADKTR